MWARCRAQHTEIGVGEIMSENEQSLEQLTKKSAERKIYTHAEAVNTSLEYFKGDELAARTFVNKYALKDSIGNIYENSPLDMHKRLAKELARIFIA